MFLLRHPFLIIFAVALLEALLLARIGSSIGWLNTIGLILLGSVIGGLLVRQQGFRTLMRLQATLREGGNPGPELLHGVLIALGGMLLMTPGFVSDTLGLLLLLPPSRQKVAAWLASRLAALQAGMSRPGFGDAPHPGAWSHSVDSHVDSGEVYDAEPEPDPEPPPQGPHRPREDDEIFRRRAREAQRRRQAPRRPDVIDGEFYRKED